MSRREFQLVNGRYLSQIGHPADPARRITVRASTRAELKQRVGFLRELREDVKIGRKSPGEVARLVDAGRRPLHLKGVWDAWAESLTETTADKAKSTWTHMVKSLGEETPIWTLDEARMRLWASELATSHAPRSIVTAFQLLSAAVSLAIRRKHLDVVPWGAWRPTRGEAVAPREAARSTIELGQLVQAASIGDHFFENTTIPDAPLPDLARRVVVMALCALRNGEGAGLGWDDIDLDRGVMLVRHQAIDGWPRRHPEWTRPLSLPKGKRSREVAIHPDALVALHDQQVFLRTCGLFLEEGPVFPVRRKDVQSGHWRRNANCIKPATFKLTAARAGLPNVERWVVHSLRHSAATLEGLAGMDLKSIQARTGHASMNVLLDYVHPGGRELPASKIPRLPAR